MMAEEGNSNCAPEADHVPHLQLRVGSLVDWLLGFNNVGDVRCQIPGFRDVAKTLGILGIIESATGLTR